MAWLGAEALACGHVAPLLRDVTFAVRSGEHWCVVGPNGSGKTTLLATVLGLLRPLAGRVLPPGGGSAAALGYVPQEPTFAVALPCTIAEFVALGLPTAVRGAAAQRAVDGALAIVGLAALASADVRRASLGQRRRALVARALARQPRVLVLDEPCASLDADAAAALLGDLERLRAAQGLALVHVTHDAAARAGATHVLELAAGRAAVHVVGGAR
jgi:ABC-type Mn2+/Zn2+ transport system ATPase subunit